MKTKAKKAEPQKCWVLTWDSKDKVTGARLFNTKSAAEIYKQFFYDDSSQIIRVEVREI